MSPLRLTGSTSGYSQIDAPAVAGDQTFTLPGTGGTLDRLNRAGNVLQVVNATYSTETEIRSTSYVDSGLSASITPSSTSSKILVFASISADSYRGASSLLRLYMNIVRTSTQILQQEGLVGAGTSADGFYYGFACTTLACLDAPATTSSTTYKVQGKLSTTSNTATLRFSGPGNSSTSTITLIEVAA